MFIGVDQGFQFRLASWSLMDDSLVSAPPVNETINGLQYDMNTMNLYGLGNYVVDSFEIGPGMYEYEYAIRFLSVDVQTGAFTEYAQYPGFRGHIAGGSTFDANNGRYIVNGVDSTFSTERIYIIDASNGQMLSDLPVTQTAGGYLNELEYNNTDNKLYGLYRNLELTETSIVSVDLSDNSIMEVLPVNDLQYFTPGASVFHQLSQSFILYYVDTNNVQKLLIADTKTGSVVANPLIPVQFTEIEVNNNIFAILNYHTVTNIDDQPAISSVNIYPNPASSLININAPAGMKISFFSSSGQLIKVFDKQAGEQSIVVSDLTPGIYYLQFTGQQVSESKALIISR
jgi:hypothetical protein